MRLVTIGCCTGYRHNNKNCRYDVPDSTGYRHKLISGRKLIVGILSFVGYNTITVIPAGATAITVVELSPSRDYFG